jgi:hypothetical protein
VNQTDEVSANAPLPEIEEMSDRQATAYRGNIRGSVKKMRELLHRIRDMPVDEAIRQMSFHHKHRRAAAIRYALENARANAVNTFNMDSTRLYVGSSFHRRVTAAPNEFSFQIPFWILCFQQASRLIAPTPSSAWPFTLVVRPV